MTTTPKTQQSNKPAASFKEGRVSSAVWGNESPTNGKRFFSITFQRSYSVEGPNQEQPMRTEYLHASTAANSMAK